jgi:hypothetical protein
MRNLVFSLLVLCSTIVFIATIIAWSVAWRVSPRQEFVSVSSDCHFSIDARSFAGNDGLEARLEIYNDASYGPYSGSIIAVTFPGKPMLDPKEIAFGDTAGIYYRNFHWKNGARLWTLSLSLIYPLIASLILPAIRLFRRRRKTRLQNIHGFTILDTLQKPLSLAPKGGPA